MKAENPFAEMHFGELRFREQLLLWSARSSIETSTQTLTVPALIREAFAVTGIPHAADQLHQLLKLIGQSGNQYIHFHVVPCQMVSADEAHFLLLLTAAGNNAREDYLLELLMEWMPPVSAARALVPARQLGNSVFQELRSSFRPLGQHFAWQALDSGRYPDAGISRLH